ncbi:hypothetical protein [Bosea sp. LjRoot237]|uniref:hypothetical protein n=1 Tax=Bosea sp. LjRoot237 TaxID=3342292 RepID=UPI003F4F8B22
MRGAAFGSALFLPTAMGQGPGPALARRLVRIAIEPGQELAERLSPGMSVVVSVDTAQR